VRVERTDDDDDDGGDDVDDDEDESARGDRWGETGRRVARELDDARCGRG
jgi:hypothetical protein